MISETISPTFIAEGSKLQGALVLFSAAGIFGIVEGELVQQSFDSLQIGKTGWIHGSITAQGPVIVEGRVDGDIRSVTRIRLGSTANVKGRLVAPAIEIEAGALIEGELNTPRRAPRPQKAA